jgi:hypothetical protein
MDKTQGVPPTEDGGSVPIPTRTVPNKDGKANMIIRTHFYSISAWENNQEGFVHGLVLHTSCGKLYLYDDINDGYYRLIRVKPGDNFHVQIDELVNNGDVTVLNSGVPYKQTRMEKSLEFKFYFENDTELHMAEVQAVPGFRDPKYIHAKYIIKLLNVLGIKKRFK